MSDHPSSKQYGGQGLAPPPGSATALGLRVDGVPVAPDGPRRPATSSWPSDGPEAEDDRTQEARRLAEIDRQVGESVRLFRTLRGLTADRLAERVGVTMQQISKYESGVNRISAGVLYLIARELGVPVSAFFEDEVGRGGGLRALLLRRGASPGDVPAREAVQLAANFSRIKDAGMRRNVLSMMRLIAQMDGVPARGAADNG